MRILTPIRNIYKTYVYKTIVVTSKYELEIPIL